MVTYGVTYSELSASKIGKVEGKKFHENPEFTNRMRKIDLETK